jgi:transposase-like protein
MAVKELTAVSVTDLWREYKRSFKGLWRDSEEQVKGLRKRLIEGALLAEQESYIGCKSYERTGGRKGYRNGYWRRWIILKGGRLEIRMPRIRGIRYRSEVIPRYKQRAADVDEALRRIFLYGVSTRRVAEAVEPILGERVSAQTISNIAKSLDEEVKRFHSRGIQDRYLYLFLDGIVLKVKTGIGSRKKVILVAYGIRVDGRREVIEFRVVNSESENKWIGFLEDLRNRGLRGEALGLIITDGHRGLEKAVEFVYPLVKRQRYWAHKLRNVANYLKKKDLKRCINEARRIYDANSRREAIRFYKQWAERWRAEYPKAVRCIEKDLEELLNFYYTPRQMWVKLRTTNVVERAFREVRRRTRLMSCFNNIESIERIVYAVKSHLNDYWSLHPLKEFTQKD